MSLNQRVNRLSHALLGAGLKKGDRIGVLVHNCHQFIELYFAAAKTGGIFCPYNNHLMPRELKEILNYSTPRFLFLDADFGETIDALAPELSLGREVRLSPGARQPVDGGLRESP